MKKILTLFLMLLTISSLFAGGIENNSNMSVGYMRNPSKNTETKKPDAVFYNPAGTVFLEKGLYLELGNQMLFLNYSNDAFDTTVNNEFHAINPILLYPNGEILWNAGNYSLFAGMGIISRGGMVEYDNGTYSSANVMISLGYPDEPHSFDSSAVVYGEVAGGAYSINDYVSVSAAVKFAQGKRTLNFELDSDPGIGTTLMEDSISTANGIGAVFGLHFNSSEKLDISLQYQTRVKMEYEYTNVDGYSIYLTAAEVAEGNRYNQDIPAVLGSGAGYQLDEDLYISLSFNYYFNKNAALDLGNGEYDDSWEIGAGAEFTFSDTAVLSGGLLYSRQGQKDEVNSPEAPVLDSLTVASGVGLTFIDDLTIDIGIFKPFYFERDFDSGAGIIKLNKELFLIGVGATYKLF